MISVTANLIKENCKASTMTNPVVPAVLMVTTVSWPAMSLAVPT